MTTPTPTLGQLVEALAVATRDGDQMGKSWLQQLREAVGGGTSKNAAGAAEQWRIPLNAAAAERWSVIVTDIGKLLTGASDMRPSPVPQVNLLAWWAVFAAARDRGDFRDSTGADWTDTIVDAATEQLGGWIAGIRALLDPPRTKHIILPCPLCGAQRIVIGDGDAAVVTDALVIEFRPGVDAIGYCRNPGCGGLWVGEFELMSLGRAAGAAINFDEVLRANVEVPRIIVPDDHREDFDPENDDHLELLADRRRREDIAELAAELGYPKLARWQVDALLAITNGEPIVIQRSRRGGMTTIRAIAAAIQERHVRSTTPTEGDAS